MHLGKFFTAALCLYMGEHYSMQAKSARSYPPEANALDQQALERFWGALATGESSAARYLSHYYSQGIGTTTPKDELLSEIFRKLDYKFVSRSPDAPANLEPGLSIIDHTVAEVYAQKTYEHIMTVKSTYGSNQVRFTEREVKENIGRLWQKMKGREQLACSVHKMLEKDTLYAYPFEALVKKARDIEAGLQKDQDFHLRPGYCSSKDDSSDNDVSPLGDNQKDSEDV